MTEPIEVYTVHEPATSDPKESLRDLIRQLNAQLLKIAQDIAKKADA